MKSWSSNKVGLDKDSSNKIILPSWIIDYPLHLTVAINNFILVLYYLLIRPIAVVHRDIPGSPLRGNTNDHLLPTDGMFQYLSNILNDKIILLILMIISVGLILALIYNKKKIRRATLTVSLTIMILMGIGSFTGMLEGMTSPFGLMYTIPQVVNIFLATAVEDGR